VENIKILYRGRKNNIKVTPRGAPESARRARVVFFDAGKEA
jgi:hypothetical protein